MRKKIIVLACTLLLVSLQIGNQFQVAYATVFIDCPDCNNGHSPSCRCGGAVDFLQPCDLCGGSGTLACDLCGGTGLSDGGTCTRCGGDLLSTCNRCGGAGSTVQPCFKPSCARCGGTGRYPEGSVITSYSIHYTKLYDFPQQFSCIPVNAINLSGILI